MVKHLPTTWETWVWSLGLEDSLEEEMATLSSTLVWKIPLTEEPGRLQFSSVQLLSRIWLFVTPWTTAHQASLSITSSQSSPKLMPIESVMPSNHLILCRPLLLPPSIFPSIRVFSNESALRIMWPKYWSFSFNISPSNEHPGLIFRMYWLDLRAVQGTLKTLLQHHFKSINSSAFSFLYSPTLTSIHDYWKNHSLDQMDLCWQCNVSAF